MRSALWLGRHHVGVDAAAHERRVVRARRLGIREPRHHDADLRALRERDRVGVVGLAARG